MKKHMPVFLFGIILPLAVCNPVRGAGRTRRPCPGLLTLHFNAPGLEAGANDFGTRQPTVSGFRPGPPGSGCPVDSSQGRALDAGATGSGSGRFTIPLDPGTSLRQGTLAFWVRPAWDFGVREIHAFVTIPMHGGRWNSIGVGYHGKIAPHKQVVESNIMDGISDHALPVAAGPGALAWKKGEWHHITLCWTEYSQYLFLDGRLARKQVYAQPLRFTRPVGYLAVGFSPTGFGDVARAWIDDVRFCTVPLYAGRKSIPVPVARARDALSPDIALCLAGATAVAESAPPQRTAADVAVLHDGKYGKAVRLGPEPDLGDAEAWLSREAMVAAIVWSRDGRTFAGSHGQGWAKAASLPRDFTVETSPDGSRWKGVARVRRFKIDPGRLEHMTAARFPLRFAPVRARYVRFRIAGDTTAKLGRFPLLDELTVLDMKGNPVPVVRITTSLSRFVRSFGADHLIDGRIGEGSCWKAPKPGPVSVLVRFPAPRPLGRVGWSRSREGLRGDGAPRDVTVAVSADGEHFEEVGARRKIATSGPVFVRFRRRPVRGIRLTILKTIDGREAELDEITAD